MEGGKDAELSAPSIVLVGLDRSHTDEQIVQGVLRGSWGFLLEVLWGRLGYVKAMLLLLASKGGAPARGTSIRLEAQPTQNVRLYCGQEILQCFLIQGFTEIDWHIARCRPYKLPRYFCKKRGSMGAILQSFVSHLK